MSQNQDTGKEGEELAASYLERKGYRIVSRNVKIGYSELDIIARKGTLLVFAEVRLRENAEYGYPEQTMTKAKIKAVKRGAEQYLERYPWHGEIRFDFLAILKSPRYEIIHFEDAYF